MNRYLSWRRRRSARKREKLTQRHVDELQQQVDSLVEERDALADNVRMLDEQLESEKVRARILELERDLLVLVHSRDRQRVLADLPPQGDSQ